MKLPYVKLSNKSLGFLASLLLTLTYDRAVTPSSILGCLKKLVSVMFINLEVSLVILPALKGKAFKGLPNGLFNYVNGNLVLGNTSFFPDVKVYPVSACIFLSVDVLYGR